jgi:protein phosphatase
MQSSATPTDPTTAADPGRKPRDDELDLFALTHPGKVRRTNQDNYLVCTLHKTMRVRGTSLPTPELLEMPSERLATLAMVADGVGGTAAGEVASRATLETLASYVTHTMRVYYASDPRRGSGFLDALRAAAMQCHSHVLSEAESRPDLKGMATTLTLVMAAWPRLFLLHLGDSRCYRLREGVLDRLTRDQTMAQDLVDSGVLPADRAGASPFASVLSSAIGGANNPLVGEFPMQVGDVYLLCTDGLTRHVSDQQIRDRLLAMQSSEQACRALLNDALEGGGVDNITIFVGRAVLKGQG